MYYGFIILLVAWLWQWYRFGLGHRSMDPWFLRLSVLGFLVLILDTFQISNWLSWANVLTLIVVILLVRRVRR